MCYYGLCDPYDKYPLHAHKHIFMWQNESIKQPNTMG